MPLFLRFNNYIEFLIQSLEIVRNMQNCIETNDNLCTELEPSVVQWSTIHIIRNGQLQVIIQIINHFTSFWRQGSKWVPTTYDKIWNLFTNCHLVSWESLQPLPPPLPTNTHIHTTLHLGFKTKLHSTQVQLHYSLVNRHHWMKMLKTCHHLSHLVQRVLRPPQVLGHRDFCRGNKGMTMRNELWSFRPNAFART